MVKRKLRGCWRAKLFRLACAALIIGAGLMVYARQAGRRGGARGEFRLAADCPRGALVYAQFSDLPALLRQWDQSELKGQYLDSTNFKQFSRGHLALKLVARWEELNNALGLTLDAAALGGAAERGAALAVYDIGRMEIVFVAPAGAEHIAASRFVLGAGQFEEVKSPEDGATYYRREEVDRGRQKQVICFAMRGGRFVFASSETLLLRALANIGGRSRADSLTDEPSFAALTARARPHFVSVWTDQTRLNNDWYFKHYWLAGNVADLKQLRAGLFALEMRDDKWIEHRDFLLRDARSPSLATPIPAVETQRLAALVSGAGAPYVWLRALGGGDQQRDTAATAVQQSVIAVRDTLFDRPAGSDGEAGGESENWDWRSFSESDFYAGGEDSWHDGYSSLGVDYDWRIDDAHDAGVAAGDESDVGRLRATTEAQAAAAMERTLRPARPLWVAGATSPRVDDGLLFVEFRRLSVVTLGTPANLDRRAFEGALAAFAQSRLMIAGGGGGNADEALKWQTRDEQGRRAWRELPLPLLGWSLCYTVRDRELFVANSPELLRLALANDATPQLPPASVAATNAARPVDEFTVIRFDERRRFFNDVVNRIDAPRIEASRLKANPAADQNASPLPSQEFFSGNITSLLSAASQVHRVEITRRSTPGRLQEEVEVIFVKKSQSHGG
ncbi:MAG: hypothetical protein H0T45_00395 [Pyrinomonadaceae bacterium]|nr:hypothetical protein [Pyrinomonadaceae bacterium]